MYKLTILLFLLSFLHETCLSSPEKSLSVFSLKVKNKEADAIVNPAGFRFSWKIKSTGSNVTQGSWRIQVSKHKTFKINDIVWDSGDVKSSSSNLVPYTGTPLEPGKQYFWKVKIGDQNSNYSGWSPPSAFFTALSTAKDWENAQWIAMDKLNPANRLVPGIHLPGKEYMGKELGVHKMPIFRKEFSIVKKVNQALVFVTGLGQYSMSINGKKTGDHFLSPGWSYYDSTVFYNVFDVTRQIKNGKNSVGVMLGNGFFNVPNSRYRKVMSAFGNPMMVMKLKLLYSDGSEETLISDQTWKCTAGSITYSSIYGGETWDNTLNQSGWELPGYDDSRWANAIPVAAPCNELRPEMDFPVKITETIPALRFIENPSLKNGFMVDFGQNASGIFQIKVKGHKGDTITFTPAELLDNKGLSNQSATGKPHFYTYITGSGSLETWSPLFSYYGFRYIQVEGATPPGKKRSNLPQLMEIKMLHNRNSSPATGNFSTSDNLFNSINTLILWAIKSNFQSVVTDCPHREKLGWLEQTYLMGEGIHFNYDVQLLYSKLVDDMITAQTKEGLVPDIVPEYVHFTGGFRDSPEWGSAAVILPWQVYRWYGDKEPMLKGWDMMKRYVTYLESKSENHILSYGLGDWFDLGPDRPGVAQLTPLSLTATAIYFYDVKLLSQMAQVLGKSDEAVHYAQWANEIKIAFNKKFYNAETGVYATGSQTAIAMPLVTGLVDSANREKVIESLINSIRQSGNSLTAGDIGFHFLVSALSDIGQGELLYEMNARDDVPGYGYQLKKGATALTESWPALENVSNNHLMLGHLMEWFYNGLGGIGQTENSVAYKHIKIEPQFIHNINAVKTHFDSPYGKIVSEWKNDVNTIRLKVEIPANTSAVVVLPVKDKHAVSLNGKPVEKQLSNVIDGKLQISVGSGKYEFVFEK